MCAGLNIRRTFFVRFRLAPNSSCIPASVPEPCKVCVRFACPAVHALIASHGFA